MEYSRNLPSVFAVLGMARALVVGTRPKQWSKNLIIYFALFFTVKEAWNPLSPGDLVSVFGKTTLAFLLFSALTGAVYLINDIMDVEKDRNHPRKRLRPIASGQLPVPVAWAGATALMALGLAFSFVLEPMFGAVSLVYLATMIAYSLVLKHVILLDVFVISAGFILRAVAGAAVLHVPISPWLYICAGLVALFLALSKRRSELVAAGDNATNQRKTLDKYTPAMLDQFISIVVPSTLLAYTLYTFTAPNLPDNHAMMLTIPFVIYGLFRYLYLVHRQGIGENPEDIITSDIPLMVSVVLWLVSAAVILVVFRG